MKHKGWRIDYASTYPQLTVILVDPEDQGAQWQPDASRKEHALVIARARDFVAEVLAAYPGAVYVNVPDARDSAFVAADHEPYCLRVDEAFVSDPPAAVQAAADALSAAIGRLS